MTTSLVHMICHLMLIRKESSIKRKMSIYGKYTEKSRQKTIVISKVEMQHVWSTIIAVVRMSNLKVK